MTSVKVGCGEGGCGACAVLVATPGGRAQTLNACLAPLASLDGAAITTAAGIAAGAPAVATALATHHASQCGFCTPGMAVACAAAAAAWANRARHHQCGGAPSTVDTVARALDGNLCRCTGYRPILDAARSLAAADVEDLVLCGGRVGAPGTDLEAAAAATAAAAGCVLPTTTGARPWASPRSLAEAWRVLAGFPAPSPPPVTIAGNTGSGVYKGTWPPPPGVPVVSFASIKELGGGVTRGGGGGGGGGGALSVPGGASLADLAAACEAAAVEAGDASPAWAGPGRWAALATHLGRVAGAHVRACASLGGNLALAAQRGLESDPATILAAAGAVARVATPDGGEEAEVDLCALLGMGGGGGGSGGGPAPASPPHPLAAALGRSALITSVTIPPPPPPTTPEIFFTTRTAARYSHAVADFNAAICVGVTGDGPSQLSHTPRIVFGAAPAGGPWRAARAPAVEAALAGATPGDPAPLAAALAAARDAIPGADAYLAGLAEAAVAAAFGQLWAAGAAAAGFSPPTKMAAVWAARPSPPPAPGTGTRTAGPPLPGSAPVGGPALKDRIEAQVSGGALYTGDLAPAGLLHAAPVLSSRARAGLDGVGVDAALSIPGVVKVITVADIPPGGSNAAAAAGDLLFADGAVTYVGQRVALVLGENAAAAAAGAAAVVVNYNDHPPAGTLGAPDGSPILSIAHAVAAGSFYELEPVIGPTTKTYGADLDAAFAAAPIVVRDVKCMLPSQAHAYMETQVAIVTLDEGGAVSVTSATQSIDMVQTAVASALGLPANKVCVKARRLGGAFGGKSARSQPIAAIAAVAAVAAGAPVRLALTRADDFAMIGGRCELEATLAAGFDESGKLLALDVDAIFLGGADPEISMFIPLLCAGTIDQNFAIPASRTTVRLARCNLPPRTIMRAPGTLQAVVIIENVLELISRVTGVDSIIVRERNLLSHPLLGSRGPRKPCAGVLADGTTAAADGPGRHADGTTAASPPHLSALALKPDGTTDEVVKTAFSVDIPLDQYTVPRLWAELKEKGDLEARQAGVAAFNADPANTFKKRGLTATACRFVMNVDPKPCLVSVHYDGTVLVNGPATEMGQGAATKTLLSACAALSKALTPAALAAHCPDGHLPLSLFRLADNSTDTLPNTGPSWGSTTSEAACEAARMAASSLAAGLRKTCEKLGAKGGVPPTWEEVVKAAHPQPGFSASSQPLTAYAYYDGTQRHGAGKQGDAPSSKALSYNGVGAAATEVEVDFLTGQTTVVRADVQLDAGCSLWTEGDLGQVEGGFLQGAGLMLSEAVRVDPATGGLRSGSFWKYKIPTSDAVPRLFNVSLASGVPHARGVLSSKAVGEPPLLLAVTILSATQACVNAMRAGLGEDAGPEETNGVLECGGVVKPAPAALLTAPATPAAVAAAVGGLPLAAWARG